jgi:hypothetical protein
MAGAGREGSGATEEFGVERARSMTVLLALIGAAPGLLLLASQLVVREGVPLTTGEPGLWLAVLGGSVGLAVGFHRGAGRSP